MTTKPTSTSGAGILPAWTLSDEISDVFARMIDGEDVTDDEAQQLRTEVMGRLQVINERMYASRNPEHMVAISAARKETGRIVDVLEKHYFSELRGDD